MGVSTVMVPTLVPMASEMMQAMTKRPGMAAWAGQYVEQQVCRALRATGCARNAGERAGHQEDEEHDDDVVVADAACAYVDLLVKGQRAVLQERRTTSANEQKATTTLTT